MLYPFFQLAAVSPTRQLAFRQLVVFQAIVVASGAWMGMRTPPPLGRVYFAHLLLVAGIIEGALLIGWRLTQLPRTQALEFLLVTPLRPWRLCLAEILVGLARLGCVTLVGLPMLIPLALVGTFDMDGVPQRPLLRTDDLWPLLAMPFLMGGLTGMILTAWAYEPRALRRWIERFMFLLILAYLATGILVGEKLGLWLAQLPEGWQPIARQLFLMAHHENPFGFMQFWMEHHGSSALMSEAAWQHFLRLLIVGVLLLTLLTLRVASRMKGHFHDRHYRPFRDESGKKRGSIGDRPLSWWAVRRVSEYSGKVNMWLAGGFGILYAAYTVLQKHDAWPSWLGTAVFQITERAGGIPSVATGLVVLSAVPAAFQYGLWDSNVQDRCRRLELLLLSRLRPKDYWNAAAAAAWHRGRGYFGIAILLWLAPWLAGDMAFSAVPTAIACAVLLWCVYFALGFRSFVRGDQGGGLGLVLTLLVPMATYVLWRLDQKELGAFLPTGMVYIASSQAAVFGYWLGGAFAAAIFTLVVARQSLANCDRGLRDWYDRNHGAKM